MLKYPPVRGVFHFSKCKSSRRHVSLRNECPNKETDILFYALRGEKFFILEKEKLMPSDLEDVTW